MNIIGALVSIFAIYKIVSDVVLSRSRKHRDEYEFIKKYINDLNNQTEHIFVLEKGFQAITGQVCSLHEIKFLLSTKNPIEVISQKQSVSAYLVFNRKLETYEWSNFYKKKWAQKYAGKLFLILYCVLAFVSLLPIYAVGKPIFNSLPFVTFIISTFVAAIFFLNKQIDFNTTKEFMKNIN